MNRSYFSGLIAGTLVVANMAAAEETGDVEAGQKLFRRCASCHMVGDDAVKRVGPVLTQIYGAMVGTVADFRYSNALTSAGQDGAVWDDAALDAFLADPRGFLPGNRMSFRGLSDAQDRADIIAYLKSFVDGDGTAVVEAGFTVSADILAIEGDVEYGEYLGSECKTCHQVSGSDDGIPNIVGLANDDFVTAMHAYREKYRENPVMQVIANRLNDEEIAALAAYFGDLEN